MSTFSSSPNADFVFSSLTQEKSTLEEARDGSNTTISESEQDLEKYLTTVKSFDNYILGKINEINSKKAQIVNILTSNFNAVNAGLSTGCLLSTSANDTNDFIVVSGTDQLINYGPASQYQGIRAQVRQDVFYVSEYPAVETYNLVGEDPEVQYDNAGNESSLAQNTRITSSNIGLGYMNMIFNSTNDPNDYSANSTLIGYYYPIAATQTNCNPLRIQVLNLETEIFNIRAEISSILSSVNSLKYKKHDFKKEIWYQKKGNEQSQFSTKIQEIDNAINTMTNYSQVIIDYEAAN